MKSNYKVAIALIAGAAIGGAAVQGLHAQAKPPAFTIAEIDVTDQEAFLKEFAPKAQKALGDNGSKALSRGGKTVALYGAPPKGRIVINRFDSLDQAFAAYNSLAYKDAKTIGDKYATFRIYAVEGLAP
jgi:uncharacterized protein (DUF1330 family)